MVLPCVPAMHDRARAPEKVVANGLRKRAVTDLPLQHRFELGVAARDGVADHDQIDVPRDVIGRISAERPDSLLDEEIAHRRIHVLIRPLNDVSATLEQGGERGHGRATHADQMDAFRVTQRLLPRSEGSGCGRVETVTRTPSGSVHVGPVVCPEGNPTMSGPEQSRVVRVIASSTVTAPPGSSHPRISPNTIARARASTPLSAKLRQHAIDSVGPLVDFLEKEHAALRWIERERSPKRGHELSDRTSEHRPVRLRHREAR